MSVERIIAPRQRHVGASEVDRLLPFHARRMVGPFIFADLIGPEELAPGVARTCRRTRMSGWRR